MQVSMLLRWRSRGSLEVLPNCSPSATASLAREKDEVQRQLENSMEDICMPCATNTTSIRLQASNRNARAAHYKVDDVQKLAAPTRANPPDFLSSNFGTTLGALLVDAEKYSHPHQNPKS